MTSSSIPSEDILPLLVELEQLQVLLNYQKPPPDETPPSSTLSPSSSTPTPPPSPSLLHHESRIISLASLLSYRLREYENTTVSLSELDSNLSQKLSSLLKEYFSIMKHKKSYLSSCFKYLCCFCSSQNSSKSNLSKEETFAIMESQFIEVIYFLRIQILQQNLQELINNYQYAHNFSTTLSEISSSTAFFTFSDHFTIEEKYLCREKLRKLFYSLNEYKTEFIHQPNKMNKYRSGYTTTPLTTNTKYQSGYTTTPPTTNTTHYTRIDGRTSVVEKDEDTPKRFHDIQIILQASHDQQNLKKAYRQVNRSLHNLCQLGIKLLLYKIDIKINDVTNLLALLHTIETDQQKAFHTLEISYSSKLISKFSSNFSLIQESMTLSHHNLTTSLVELSHRWSLLRANVTSPTFLSSYFGSGDEDLDEMFPSSSASTSSSIRPKMNSSSTSQRLSFTSVMDSLSSSNSSSHKSPGIDSSHTPSTTNISGASTSPSGGDSEDTFSLQMKRIFLDSFNATAAAATATTTPPLPPSATAPAPNHHHPSFFTITSDSNHSNYSNQSSPSLEGEGDTAAGDSDEKIIQLKNKFKNSITSVAQKASKAAASAAAIASNSTQKAVSLASEAKNKVTNRPRRGSRGSGGGGLMTGSYTALVDMN
jgi:hypothetical protein